mmetsp:Transcript_28507/g.77200  ORF Transcript_28507/g.77200 Transcript_28507/m.77200 type:complete len:298 (-) Transcript_28507:95-988(-)|eukprot:CAMPEP_0171191090 /NCGR_PEP_ID=MMETSP0790-20130122/19187_1 /TAXON_ID=2925 /ORGANISM="Alexandrium catenella, Strain OF101" /LENGTH=297 /DNA_ID=CAMNT_0011656231 /DNA_START=81 /DNA_END=974 /DNA_ORIENTATION=+
MWRQLRLALGCLSCFAVRDAHAARDLYIIGAGLPRTGSQSLAIALSKLGYKTAHGVGPFDRQAWCDWLGRGGSFEPALRTITEHNVTATMDQPACLAYKELLRRFPSAKVVLTLHEDADSWYDSLDRHIRHWSRVVYHPGICNRLLLNFHPYSGFVGGFSVGKHLECAQMQAARYGCQGMFSDPDSEQVRQECIEGYNRHNDEVRRVVPPAQLLVFKAIDGWAPLCDFLGVPTPVEPFPESDNSLLVAAALSSASCSLLVRAAAASLWPAFACLGALAIWAWRRRSGATAGGRAKDE